MDQLVRVKEVFQDGTADVLLVRESACSGDCHKCSGCGAAKETLIVRAQNPIHAGLGAEGDGMRRLTEENCDFLIRIPMFGSVPCLNVSVATGVCLYEAVRQRNICK